MARPTLTPTPRLTTIHSGPLARWITNFRIRRALRRWMRNQ